VSFHPLLSLFKLEPREALQVLSLHKVYKEEGSVWILKVRSRLCFQRNGVERTHAADATSHNEAVVKISLGLSRVVNSNCEVLTTEL